MPDSMQSKPFVLVIGGDKDYPVLLINDDDDPNQMLGGLVCYLRENQLSREQQMRCVRAYWTTLLSQPDATLDALSREAKQTAQELLQEETEQES